MRSSVHRKMALRSQIWRFHKSRTLSLENSLEKWREKLTENAAQRLEAGFECMNRLAHQKGSSYG